MAKITNQYDREISTFVDAMKYKLHVNRHKGKWEDMSLDSLFVLLRQEVDELEAEIKDPSANQTAVLLESADVSNIAMMIADVALRIASGELEANGTKAIQTSIFDTQRQ